MPGKPSEYEDFSDTIFPEGLEPIHPRYAISHRNTWMLTHSDYVITYITHPWSGAAQFAKKASSIKKSVIALSG